MIWYDPFSAHKGREPVSAACASARGEEDACDRASASRASSRGRAHEAFDLQRSGGRSCELPNGCQRLNCTALPTTDYPTTSTRNRNDSHVLEGKAADPENLASLQLDREDLRLVDEVELELKRCDIVGDSAVVRFGPGYVVVRIAVLDWTVSAAEVPLV